MWINTIERLLESVMAASGLLFGLIILHRMLFIAGLVREFKTPTDATKIFKLSFRIFQTTNIIYIVFNLILIFFIHKNVK